MFDDLKTPGTGNKMPGMLDNSGRKNELRYKGIEFLQLSSWQYADHTHQPGSGILGYRAVYKTLKLIPIPSVKLSWPNLRVRMVVEKIEYGGINVNVDTIPSIFPNRLLLPEYIQVNREGNSINFVGNINMKWEFAPFIKELPVSGIVEILQEVEHTDEGDIISEGRRKVSPILTILDLVYGERLIGALIAEEIVELFPDGHWNRNAFSPSVGSESQLDMKKFQLSQIEQMKKSIDSFQGLPEIDRKKIALATDWFWKSEKEDDRKDRFIQLWISLEALEMINSNIKPIAQHLTAITSEVYEFWHKPIGRLYGKRSNLVHGKSNSIEEYEIILLRGIVKLLLSDRLGKIENQELTQELIPLIKFHY